MRELIGSERYAIRYTPVLTNGIVGVGKNCTIVRNLTDIPKIVVRLFVLSAIQLLHRYGSKYENLSRYFD